MTIPYNQFLMSFVDGLLKMIWNSILINALICHVCFMKNPPEIVPLKMCLKDLKQVDNVKILGVTISSDLKWDLHMSQVYRKASNKLYVEGV